MVHLQVKTTSGKKVDVEIELESTVLACKEALVALTDVPVELQRLIFKGKVLKDDLTLSSYGIEAEQTLYFVKGAASKPRTTASVPRTQSETVSTSQVSSTASAPSEQVNSFYNPMQNSNIFGAQGGQAPLNNSNMFSNLMGMQANAGGGMPDMAAMQQQMMQNPEMMQQILDSPLFQGVLNNPDLMRSMMASNPQMQQLLEQNPQLNHVMNDPELLRQSIEAMRNPAAMREMMRSQDSALRNIESLPGGFNALARMYHDVQEPLMDAASSGTTRPSPAFTMPGATSTSNATISQTQSTNSTTSSAPSNGNPWATSSSSNSSSNPTNNPWGGAGTTVNPFGMGGGAPNPEMMMQMMQNPMFQSAMEQLTNNPQQFLQMMETMNPQMRTMLNANPQMRQMMENPEFLRAAMNPANMQAMMQMQSALNQLGGSGLMPGFQGMNFGSNTPSDGSATNPFASFGAPAPAAGSSTVNPEEAYASQLSQLADMGFTDRAQNLRALQATMGNVHAAVERILSGSI